MAGGGTWTIKVEEGQVSKETQSTVAGGSGKPTRPGLGIGESSAGARKARQLVQNGIFVGLAITKTSFNQYYSITGQGAKRNQLNTALVYGTGVMSIGVQLATGNLVGAAIATVGATVGLGNQYVSFQRDLAEQNASAEYLRQQSGTSVSSNRGEMYNFSLF